MSRFKQLKQFSEDQSNMLFFGLLLDKDGILWLSSTTLGVYRVNFPKKQFRLFDPRSFSNSQQGGNASSSGIRALFQAKNGDIWVGTVGRIYIGWIRMVSLNRSFLPIILSSEVSIISWRIIKEIFGFLRKEMGL